MIEPEVRAQRVVATRLENDGVAVFCAIEACYQTIEIDTLLGDVEERNIDRLKPRRSDD